MYWANFIHIYQPPTQKREIVDKVTRECYRPLTELLRRHPLARLTVNISGTLTEQLHHYGHDDVIRNLCALAESGQIEFTGSAMFHPILPLLPQVEVRRQILLNEHTNEKYFGNAWQARGFFPPEMCYSHHVAEVVRDLGYRWILADEIAWADDASRPFPRLSDRCYEVEGLPGLSVFFKERTLSARLTYGDFPTAAPFLEALRDDVGHKGYVLTGTDGEIYGHHRPGQEQLLEEIFRAGAPQTRCISELFDLFPARQQVRPLPSSWSTWPRELHAGVPYPQWDDPDNDLHRLQWQLARLVIDAAHTAERLEPDEEGTRRMRRLLDEGLHSCQWWWASCRPWWDVGMIAAGAARLREAAELASDLLGPACGEHARALEERIVLTAKIWHEGGEARRRKERYRQDNPEVSSELTFA